MNFKRVQLSLQGNLFKICLIISATATSKCPTEHKYAASEVMQWFNAFVVGPHSNNGMLNAWTSFTYAQQTLTFNLFLVSDHQTLYTCRKCNIAK